jgi:hypothetical protein
MGIVRAIWPLTRPAGRNQLGILIAEKSKNIYQYRRVD